MEQLSMFRRTDRLQRASDSRGVPQWYVGQSPASFGAAAKAVEAIRQMGLNAYQPLRYETCYVRKRGHAVWQNGQRAAQDTPRPFLSNYWFVAFDIDEDPWGPILQIKPWVSRLIGRNAYTGRPTPVEPGFVDALMADAGPTGILPKGYGERPIEPLTRNTPVTILEGAFASFPATVDVDQGDRIMIVAQIFGRAHKFPVTREQIKVEARLGR